MLTDYQVEICAGSLNDVLTADKFSETDRIELNSAIELGGLTPSLHTFKKARAATAKKIICMVRPRCAGFVYTKEETDIMFADAQEFLENDADGIVFGFLNSDHTIDVDTTNKMVSLIHGYGKEAVFHKAFDETPDPMQACRDLISCNVDRILTSGQKSSTDQGTDLIRKLIQEYGSRIEILPGGGINEKNICEILRTTGASQFHMTAKSALEDCGTYYAVNSDNIRKVFNSVLTSSSENKHIKTREDDEMMKNDLYEG